jgi:hypothetical protein
MLSKTRIGFHYRFECCTAAGETQWEFEEDNLIPNEGINYLLNAGLTMGAQFSNWYIGIYEGNYPPQPTDTMATFAAAATETTAYSETTRALLVPDAISGGVYANNATPVSFTFTAAKTIRGGFISSSSTKNGATGVLLSAVLASSPKTVGVGEILRVTAGLSLVTV